MASIRSHTLLSAAHPATTFMNRLGFGSPSDYTLFISFNSQVKLFSEKSGAIFGSKSPGTGLVPSSGGMRHRSLHFGESHFPLKASVFMRSRQQVPHCHEYPQASVTDEIGIVCLELQGGQPFLQGQDNIHQHFGMAAGQGQESQKEIIFSLSPGLQSDIITATSSEKRG